MVRLLRILVRKRVKETRTSQNRNEAYDTGTHINKQGPAKRKIR